MGDVSITFLQNIVQIPAGFGRYQKYRFAAFECKPQFLLHILKPVLDTDLTAGIQEQDEIG